MTEAFNRGFRDELSRLVKSAGLLDGGYYADFKADPKNGMRSIGGGIHTVYPEGAEPYSGHNAKYDVGRYVEDLGHNAFRDLSDNGTIYNWQTVHGTTPASRNAALQRGQAKGAPFGNVSTTTPHQYSGRFNTNLAGKPGVSANDQAAASQYVVQGAQPSFGALDVDVGDAQPQPAPTPVAQAKGPAPIQGANRTIGARTTIPQQPARGQAMRTSTAPSARPDVRVAVRRKTPQAVGPSGTVLASNKPLPNGFVYNNAAARARVNL